MRHAFTLVELLIVVGIIGLLATIGVAAYSNAKVNGRNMQRKANLAQMAKALEMYANDHGGQYPSTSGAWWGETTSYGSHATTGANGYIPNFAPEYLQILPHDPNTNITNPSSAYAQCRDTASYSSYLYRSNGVDYKLIAHCTPEGTMSATDPFYDAGRATWAWMVASPGGRAW